MMSNLAKYVEKKKDHVNLAAIANTLAQRSLFGWRIAVPATSSSQLVSALHNPLHKPVYSRDVPRLCFVFNGAGAQWCGMGRELFAYPVYAEAMLEADKILRGFGAPWSLIGMSTGL
jgi:acyl transferase domain-containing protein